LYSHKALSQLWKRNIHGDSRNILLIQYLFVFLLSNPEPTRLSPDFRGGIGKGTYRADKTWEKELWAVETFPSHGEEDEKGHHQAKEPHGF
jgi:hypothetical protein